MMAMQHIVGSLLYQMSLLRQQRHLSASVERVSQVPDTVLTLYMFGLYICLASQLTVGDNILHCASACNGGGLTVLHK